MSLDDIRARLAALRSASPPRPARPKLQPQPPGQAGAQSTVGASASANGGARVTPSPLSAAPEDAEVQPSPFTIPPPKAGTARASRATSVKQLAYEARRELRLNGERPSTPPVADRPRTRGECAGGPRPCPLVGCRHHNAFDVSEAGSLVENRPDTPVEESTASCSLDVADAGPHTLDAVGAVLNLTKERVRQVETIALGKMAAALEPKMLGSCRARCAESGRQCRLPAHGPEVRHRHERGPFVALAAPGQTRFAERERLEDEARRVPFSAVEALTPAGLVRALPKHGKRPPAEKPPELPLGVP